MSRQSKPTIPPNAWPIWIGLAVLALQSVRSISQSDFWLHLASGRAIASGGIQKMDPLTGGALAWRNVTWLYDWLLYGFWSLGGAGLVILIHTAILVATFYLLARSVSTVTSPLAIGFALLLAAWLIAPVLSFSPILISLLLIAAYMYLLLTRPISPALFAWILPLQVLWVNVHSGFLWGPVVILIFAVQAYLQHAKDHRQRESLMTLGLAAAALLVCLLNPHGFAVLPAAGAIWSQPGIGENISPLAGQFAASPLRHLVTLALAIGALGLLTWKQRLPVALTALAVISAFMAVQSHPLYVALFALMSFPFLALSLQAFSNFMTERLAGNMTRIASGALIAIALFSAFVLLTNRYYTHIGSLSKAGLGVTHTAFPAGVVDQFGDDTLPAPQLHFRLDGGYLAWHYHERAIMIDQRSTLHGSEKYAQLARGLMGNEEDWLAISTEFQPRAILISHLWPLAADALRHLTSQDQWEVIYFDGTSSVLVQNRPEHASLLAEKQTTLAAGLTRLEEVRRSYQQQLGGIRRPAVSASLFGAGHMFRDRRLYPQAVACFEPLTRGAPRLVTARLSLGICRLRLQQFEIAIDDLTKARAALKPGSSPWLLAMFNVGMAQVETQAFPTAIRSLEQVVAAEPQNLLAWLWLSRAYTGNQQLTDAQQAIQRARELDPDLTQRFLNP